MSSDNDNTGFYLIDRPISPSPIYVDSKGVKIKSKVGTSYYVPSTIKSTEYVSPVASTVKSTEYVIPVSPTIRSTEYVTPVSPTARSTEYVTPASPIAAYSSICDLPTSKGCLEPTRSSIKNLNNDIEESINKEEENKEKIQKESEEERIKLEKRKKELEESRQKLLALKRDDERNEEIRKEKANEKRIEDARKEKEKREKERKEKEKKRKRVELFIESRKSEQRILNIAKEDLNKAKESVKKIPNKEKREKLQTEIKNEEIQRNFPFRKDVDFRSIEAQKISKEEREKELKNKIDLRNFSFKKKRTDIIKEAEANLEKLKREEKILLNREKEQNEKYKKLIADYEEKRSKLKEKREGEEEKISKISKLEKEIGKKESLTIDTLKTINLEEDIKKLREEERSYVKELKKDLRKNITDIEKDNEKIRKKIDKEKIKESETENEFHFIKLKEILNNTNTKTSEIEKKIKDYVAEKESEEEKIEALISAKNEEVKKEMIKFENIREDLTELLNKLEKEAEIIKKHKEEQERKRLRIEKERFPTEEEIERNKNEIKKENEKRGVIDRDDLFVKINGYQNKAYTSYTDRYAKNIEDLLGITYPDFYSDFKTIEKKDKFGKPIYIQKDKKDKSGRTIYKKDKEGKYIIKNGEKVPERINLMRNGNPVTEHITIKTIERKKYYDSSFKYKIFKTFFSKPIQLQLDTEIYLIVKDIPVAKTWLENIILKTIIKDLKNIEKNIDSFTNPKAVEKINKEEYLNKTKKLSDNILSILPKKDNILKDVVKIEDIIKDKNWEDAKDILDDKGWNNIKNFAEDEKWNELRQNVKNKNSEEMEIFFGTPKWEKIKKYLQHKDYKTGFTDIPSKFIYYPKWEEGKKWEEIEKLFEEERLKRIKNFLGKNKIKVIEQYIIKIKEVITNNKKYINENKDKVDKLTRERINIVQDKKNLILEQNKLNKISNKKSDKAKELENKIKKLKEKINKNELYIKRYGYTYNIKLSSIDVSNFIDEIPDLPRTKFPEMGVINIEENDNQNTKALQYYFDYNNISDLFDLKYLESFLRKIKSLNEKYVNCRVKEKYKTNVILNKIDFAGKFLLASKNLLSYYTFPVLYQPWLIIEKEIFIQPYVDALGNRFDNYHEILEQDFSQVLKNVQKYGWKDIIDISDVGVYKEEEGTLSGCIENLTKIIDDSRGSWLKAKTEKLLNIRQKQIFVCLSKLCKAIIEVDFSKKEIYVLSRSDKTESRCFRDAIITWSRKNKYKDFYIPICYKYLERPENILARVLTIADLGWEKKYSQGPLELDYAIFASRMFAIYRSEIIPPKPGLISTIKNFSLLGAIGVISLAYYNLTLEDVENLASSAYNIIVSNISSVSVVDGAMYSMKSILQNT